ncbi:hypothetical protein Asppvi_008273 [Aspergillus pseudoviridinutans]|uniref:Ankyrin repeat-containing domain protein n=1 Tax=Aspergillus pseudoviridinutans TaxID=1517512 RepID=A0A9P3EY05_9EURO|nr:uncharacterized protein Asppvi_008273 [Aspergillus pseudoviridinutans]GIJ89335.1 hypothetical protein Asppvi_008273 [Aspergillus pseudoviridinutans]
MLVQLCQSNTPMGILAARGGHEAIVRLIIEKGASPDMVAPEGSTLLSVAAWNGHVALTRTLLALGARQDNVLPPSHALTVASRRGHKKVAAILLPDLENNYNEALGDMIKVEALLPWSSKLLSGVRETPLNTAAENGDTDILLLLLKHGADPNRVLNRHGRVGHAAPTKAVLHNHEEAALILVQHTERLHCTRALSIAMQQDDKGWAAPDFSLSDLAGHSEEDDLTYEWVQPIVYAVQSQDTRLVEMLLDHGANVNVQCPGWPKTGYDVVYSHVLFWLWRNSVKQWLIFYLSMAQTQTLLIWPINLPLTYASSSGNGYIIKSLLDHGANLCRAVDNMGKRVLSYKEVSISIRTMLEEAEKNWSGEP